MILMHSTSHAIRAEKLLYQAGIESKLIPAPRHLSSDCGVCLRIERADVEQARKTLEDSRMEIEGVHEI